MNIHRSARTTLASRVLLVERVRKQGWSVSEAAEAFGISGRTVRKWLQRSDELGTDGLHDGSSRPKRQPNKTGRTLEAMILDLRDFG